MSERRKLKGSLSDPIQTLVEGNDVDTIVFIEKDNKTALKTRAAALMYIGRHRLNLTTSVRGDQIWIMKDKDYPGAKQFIDLRKMLGVYA